MQSFKILQPAPSKTGANGQNQAQRVVNPSAEVGRSKVDSYQTDKWVVGRDSPAIYIVPKNTIPERLSSVFVRANKPDPVTHRVDYDDAKFMLDEITDDDCDRVTISLRNPSEEVADVEFDENSFVVRIFDLPKSGVFPFNKDEFLKAVDAAKWTFEMFVMKVSDSNLEKP